MCFGWWNYRMYIEVETMNKYYKATTWELYHSGMNEQVWEAYSDSDLLICFDSDNVWYLFTSNISDSNLIASSENLTDIENCIIDMIGVYLPF